MSTKRFSLLFAAGLLLSAITVIAQDDGSYKMPPKAIVDMLLAKPAPNVSVDDKGEWMLLTEVSLYPSVEELAKPELRIAGQRINPQNFSPSRVNFISNFWLKNITTGKEYKISCLPSPLCGITINWSPNFKKIGITHSTNDRIDLYVVDVASQKATKINKTPLNVVAVNYQWYDDNSLLYLTTLKPASAAPSKPLKPLGPTVQENYGKASPRPTFQDMIKSPYDEQLY